MLTTRLAGQTRALDHTPRHMPNSRRGSWAGKSGDAAAVSLGSSLCWQPVHTPRGQIPGPCSLPSVLAREVPEVRKPVLFHSSLPWGTGPTCILPAPVFSFSLTRLHGGLSFSTGYLRSACSQLVFCENCSSFKCSFDVFVGGVNSVFFYFTTSISSSQTI